MRSGRGSARPTPFAVPVMVLLAFLVLGPLAVLVFSSARSTEGTLPFEPESSWTTANYEAVLSAGTATIVWNTLVLTVGALLVVLEKYDFDHPVNASGWSLVDAHKIVPTPAGDGIARHQWPGVNLLCVRGEGAAGPRELVVDEGAARALADGRSLLPAGVRQVTGVFHRGDPVVIRGPSGAALAQGLARYDSTDAVRIAGKRSDEIAAILGEQVRAALVHRDDMAVNR